MISRPRGEIGVVVGLHLQAKQWQQAEVVFQAGSEALPKGDSVQPHLKKNESNIAGFNNFPKKSSNNSHFPCFIISSSNFAPVFQVVASGDQAAKAAELIPDIVS